jgi:hypothetical protein
MVEPLLISTTGNSSSNQPNRQEASSSIRQKQSEVEQSSPEGQSQMIQIEGVTLSRDLIKFAIVQQYSISVSKDS